MAECLMNAVLQRASDGCTVPFSEFDRALDRRPLAREAAHGIGAQQSPESRERLFVLDRQFEIEFEEPA